tara:strand:+ start:542 stop:754 length:213 start_codon:yes stop_codon:yes gene_type:complete
MIHLNGYDGSEDEVEFAYVADKGEYLVGQSILKKVQESTNAEDCREYVCAYVELCNMLMARTVYVEATQG